MNGTVVVARFATGLDYDQTLGFGAVVLVVAALIAWPLLVRYMALRRWWSARGEHQ